MKRRIDRAHPVWRGYSIRDFPPGSEVYEIYTKHNLVGLCESGQTPSGDECGALATFMHDRVIPGENMMSICPRHRCHNHCTPIPGIEEALKRAGVRV